jgi:hypothetical protein
MDRTSFLLTIVILGIGGLILGGLLADSITALVRRYVPRFSFDGEIYLFWGILVLTAFTLGLMAMYLALR